MDGVVIVQSEVDCDFAFTLDFRIRSKMNQRIRGNIALPISLGTSRIFGLSENSWATLAVQKLSVSAVIGIITLLSQIQSQNIPLRILGEVIKLIACPLIIGSNRTPPMQESLSHWVLTFDSRHVAVLNGIPDGITVSHVFLFSVRWGGRWGSNPRQQESQSWTLPTELQPPLKLKLIWSARQESNL